MARVIEVGVAAADTFAAYEDDGYTKRSGLSYPADFSVTFFKDGAVATVPFTISEVGVLGEYKVEFTPPSIGFYSIQVLIDFSKEVVGSSYTVITELTGTTLATIIAQVDKIDLIPTLAPNAAATGSLLDRLCNKSVLKSYNQATDSLEALRDRMG